MEQTLYRHKNIIEPDRLSGYFFHINTQLLCFHKNFLYASAHLQCCQNHLKSTHQLEVHHLLDSCHVKTWLRCHMTCWVGSSHSSYNRAKFVGLASCESKGKIIFICYVTTWSIYYVTLSVGPVTISHYSAKFGIHGAWESGDITPLICHVTKWWMGFPHSKSAPC